MTETLATLSLESECQLPMQYFWGSGCQAMCCSTTVRCVMTHLDTCPHCKIAPNCNGAPRLQNWTISFHALRSSGVTEERPRRPPVKHAAHRTAQTQAGKVRQHKQTTQVGRGSVRSVCAGTCVHTYVLRCCSISGSTFVDCSTSESTVNTYIFAFVM